uniref:Complex III subunit 9 n=1 Tax=Daphnia galeata TaxID=27404 RepID=A0A8J2WBZ7_9CRUS|nr:unnamed protein product [Daphnia galeata]
MSLVAKLYHNIARRSSTYALAIITGAFFFERGFDMASEHLYDEINKGKQWKDIKAKYAPAE